MQPLIFLGQCLSAFVQLLYCQHGRGMKRNTVKTYCSIVHVLLNSVCKWMYMTTLLEYGAIPFLSQVKSVRIKHFRISIVLIRMVDAVSVQLNTLLHKPVIVKTEGI